MVWIFSTPGLRQLLEQVFGDLLVRGGDDLAGLLVDDVVRQHFADQEILRHRMLVQASRLHLAHVLDGDPLVLGHDQLALLGHDVEARDLAAQALGN